MIEKAFSVCDLNVEWRGDGLMKRVLLARDVLYK